jgi:hypothetical protein
MAKSDEMALESVAKRILAMPHKPRDDSKIGKPIAKAKKSPPSKKKPSR